MGRMRRGRGFEMVEGEHCPYCDRITGGPYHGRKWSKRLQRMGIGFTTTDVCERPECQARHKVEVNDQLRALHPEMSDEEFAAAIQTADEGFEQEELARAERRAAEGGGAGG